MSDRRAGYPVRYWDHDLGPGAPRLLIGLLTTDEQVVWNDLTPRPERALDEASYDLTPDGSQVVVTWTVSEPHGSRRTTLVVVDARTGSRHVLADGEGHEYGDPKVSPDGTRVACIRWTRSTPLDPGDCLLVVLGLDGGAEQVVDGWDRWPTSVRTDHP